MVRFLRTRGRKKRGKGDTASGRTRLALKTKGKRVKKKGERGAKRRLSQLRKKKECATFPKRKVALMPSSKKKKGGPLTLGVGCLCIWLQGESLLARRRGEVGKSKLLFSRRARGGSLHTFRTVFRGRELTYYGGKIDEYHSTKEVQTQTK